MGRSEKVKGFFSPRPVDDSVDNWVGISPEPRPALLLLRCSPNGQLLASLRFFCESQASGRPFHVVARESVPAAGTHAQPQHPRCACIGGHFTVPNEQKTQQSPGLGRRSTLQPSHS